MNTTTREGTFLPYSPNGHRCCVCNGGSVLEQVHETEWVCHSAECLTAWSVRRMTSDPPLDRRTALAVFKLLV